VSGRKPQRGALGKPRDAAESVAKAIENGGQITIETLTRLRVLLDERTTYPHHIELVVWTGALMKTIDNERDALETIRRLEAKPVSP